MHHDGEAATPLNAGGGRPLCPWHNISPDRQARSERAALLAEPSGDAPAQPRTPPCGRPSRPPTLQHRLCSPDLKRSPLQRCAQHRRRAPLRGSPPRPSPGLGSHPASAPPHRPYHCSHGRCRRRSSRRFGRGWQPQQPRLAGGGAGRAGIGAGPRLARQRARRYSRGAHQHGPQPRAVSRLTAALRLYSLIAL
jgi:hypothetical protein